MIRKKKEFTTRNPRKKKKSKTPYNIDQTKNTKKKEKEREKKKQTTNEKMRKRWFYHLTTTTFLLLHPYFINDSILVGLRTKFSGSSNLPFSLLINQTPKKKISLLFSLSHFPSSPKSPYPICLQTPSASGV